MKLRRGGRRAARTRLERIVGGLEVDVPCRLRRTSSRGWGPWIEGVIRLPASGSVEVVFVPDDPTQVSLVSGRAGRPGPVPLPSPAPLKRRRVRFKGEAFYGIDGEVFVVSAENHVTEVALATDELDVVATRLAAAGIGD